LDTTINFKGWAVSHNIKQKDIAVLLGITHQSVSNKMNGRTPYTLPEIKLLNRTYGVPADVFLN